MDAIATHNVRNFPIAQCGLALCRDAGHFMKLIALEIDAACERLFMPPVSRSGTETRQVSLPVARAESRAHAAFEGPARHRRENFSPRRASISIREMRSR